MQSNRSIKSQSQSQTTQKPSSVYVPPHMRNKAPVPISPSVPANVQKVVAKKDDFPPLGGAPTPVRQNNGDCWSNKIKQSIDEERRVAGIQREKERKDAELVEKQRQEQEKKKGVSLINPMVCMGRRKQTKVRDENESDGGEDFNFEESYDDPHNSYQETVRTYDDLLVEESDDDCDNGEEHVNVVYRQ